MNNNENQNGDKKPPQNLSQSIGASGATANLTEDDAKIADLAQLSALEYEKCRQTEAENMGLRVSFLDAEVADARPVDAAAQTLAANQSLSVARPALPDNPNSQNGNKIKEKQ